VIEVHISRLRSKIDKGHKQALLHTVRGEGYVLRDECRSSKREFAKRGAGNSEGIESGARS
jgi:DNA-binding winged helix-turn-helix (wHTH) protein